MSPMTPRFLLVSSGNVSKRRMEQQLFMLHHKKSPIRMYIGPWWQWKKRRFICVCHHPQMANQQYSSHVDFKYNGRGILSLIINDYQMDVQCNGRDTLTTIPNNYQMHAKYKVGVILEWIRCSWYTKFLRVSRLWCPALGWEYCSKWW